MAQFFRSLPEAARQDLSQVAQNSAAAAIFQSCSFAANKLAGDDTERRALLLAVIRLAYVRGQADALKVAA